MDKKKAMRVAQLKMQIGELQKELETLMGEEPQMEEEMPEQMPQGMM